MRTERLYYNAEDRDRAVAERAKFIEMARMFESSLRARTDIRPVLVELARCMSVTPRRAAHWLAVMCQHCADLHGADGTDALSVALRRHDLDAVLDALESMDVPGWGHALERLWSDALPLGVAVQIARAVGDRYDD